ncbi:adenylate/guanylate cyclase domain-containing protein [Pseudonocardia abyssalis]|uniref:Adenylate/guanylate cyclase domain-containing protein n=1 Tax=Pseudonocardia abyssalis TaxID=2792008 RepID=A0ABS6UYN7_9PSEU|nr:adenylate/guanylate cyclase domain-containing protein [Pseudonocardia abyssalis]MBW0116151.1 adenylate/guanylate cyclase domain-containing protein [Pseudonocardia abyssalis]MBW0137362.1 adenylate/guanylate cyclase domain-containing protein [Pseudonocardia abyssalis]
MARRRWVVAWPVRVALLFAVVVANIIGAGVVLVLSAWVLPNGPLADPDRTRVVNLIMFGCYLLLALVIGAVWGGRRFRMKLGGGTEVEQRREHRRVLYGPLRLTTVQGVLWLTAVLLFGGVNAQYSWRLALSVAETTLLGGITTCALAYLLSERILRRTTGRVLSRQPPRRRVLPGVVVRSLLFWALGTAVPVVGVLLAAVSALAHGDIPSAQLAVIMLTLGGTSLITGFLATVGSARAVADPVNAVRRAMRRVERGRFDAEVTVYDGTELGQLQSGFNTMVAGLTERERIRDLFGRHVGRDVAEAAAAAQEVRLGGEVRSVAVLFVDLVGSTQLAVRRPAAEVVGVLNRFFGVVVEVVEEHGGWINKFQGDAALAVFGAPVAVSDPAGSALAAGRELGARLAAELPEIEAGIGVSAGDAVAGNVGDVRRFEYTVIGDPVNEAARLTELAKSVPGGVVAAGRAVGLAAEGERARWELGGETELRGRGEVTRLATPLGSMSTDDGGKPREIAGDRS